MEDKRISFLNIALDILTKKRVLEKIKIYLSAPPKFIHIVSINPENVVIAQHNPLYRAAIQNADLALTDGIGIVFSSRLLGLSPPERIPGSRLLSDLLDLAGQMSSTVVLIGSQANLADKIAKCYSYAYPKAKFIGIQGYRNALSPTAAEEEYVEDIVRSTRPHFVFVAFGSPTQELWIDAHRKILQASICMGVGGGFNYLSGASQRPPNIISRVGLEWLYRLIREPWRMKRQCVRLPIFVGLVLKQLVRRYNTSTK